MSDDPRKAEQEAKALDGSFEAIRNDLTEALAGSGMFADAWIRDTFEDHVVVTSWPPEGVDAPVRYFEVDYTEGDDGLEFTGEPREVEIEVSETASPKGGDGVGGGINSKDWGSRQEPKTMPFELKAYTDGVEVDGVKGWTFEGYASVWDVVDHEMDVVRRGAFKRTLEEGLPKVKDHHGPTVGKVIEAREDDHGLWVKGFVPDDPATSLLHKLMRLKAVSEMSYGWAAFDGGMKRLANGVRELTSLKVFEVSPVTFGMNPATEITSVKSEDDLDELPVGDLLLYAADTLVRAVSEAQALVERRQNDKGRTIAPKAQGAMAYLGTVAATQLDTLADLARDLDAEAGAEAGNGESNDDDDPESSGEAEALHDLHAEWIERGLEQFAPSDPDSA